MYSVGDKCGAVRSRSTPHDVVSFVVVIVSDERGKCAAVDRFRDVAVATGGKGVILIAFHGIRGQRHNDDIAPRRVPPQLACQLLPIHSRELDVHEN